jgi:hypothetical protein
MAEMMFYEAATMEAEALVCAVVLLHGNTSSPAARLWRPQSQNREF